jgi:hypothetical protein
LRWTGRRSSASSTISSRSSSRRPRSRAGTDFGAEVVIIGQEREILPAFDADVAGYLRKIFEAEASPFVSARVTRFEL